MPKYSWLYLKCRKSRLNLNFLFFALFFSSQIFSQNLDLSSLRDPFASPQDNEHKIPEKVKEQPINLVGIVQVGDSLGAILERHGSQEVVFLNDKIWGCIVQKVTKDFVIVSREGRRSKLFFN